MNQPSQPLPQLTDIHKPFPGRTANDNVNLSINTGEVHALFGENGAGKSTLVKIIYGVLKADAGVMHWNGADVAIGQTGHATLLISRECNPKLHSGRGFPECQGAVFAPGGDAHAGILHCH